MRIKATARAEGLKFQFQEITTLELAEVADAFATLAYDVPQFAVADLYSDGATP